MKEFLMRKIRSAFLLFYCAIYMTIAFGLDNPDAPDYVNDFLNKANTYEEKLMQGSYSTQDYIYAYAEYENFLDGELNKTYRLLMSNLDKDSQALLKQSQRKWLIYRDTEFDFIRSNWNKVDFGSSSAISKGSYRVTIIKYRVISLLHYLKNYSP